MSDSRIQTDERTAQRVMLDQQLALGAYLQALLKPVEETGVVTSAPVVDLPVETVTRVEVPVVRAVPEPTPVSASEPEVETTDPAAAVEANPYPEWAASDFQCLLFRVAGLTLALPLAKLNGVLPWDGDLVTPMPGHQAWFVGLREYQGQKVRLIDVAQVILPRGDSAPESSFGKVILIGGGRWGLVCEDIAEVVTLAAPAVKWRSRSGNRPWLAGTVIDRMCALIDAEVFADMLGTDGPTAA